MPTPPEPRSSAAQEFVEQFLEDCSCARFLPLDHYLARFRGREPEIVRAYLALLDDPLGFPRRAEQRWRPGMRFARFELLCELGCGSEAAVFGARETAPLHPGHPPRLVALRIFHDGHAHGRGSELARIARTLRLLADLDEQAFCRVHATGVAHDHAWVAMRWVRGASLARCLAFAHARAAGVPPPVIEAPLVSPALLPVQFGPQTAAGIARTLCFFALAARALARAHELGFVHGDLRPANLMQDLRGLPVVLDFGLERNRRAGSPRYESRHPSAYLAPELYYATRSCDPRAADVYALAATLQECLGPDALASSSPRMLPRIPRSVRELLTHALEPDPWRRIDMRQLSGALASHGVTLHAREPA